MRQDPDVILVGEMRDAETVSVVLAAAAETGLILPCPNSGTRVDAQETVNRITDFFPPHEQQQIRFALAGALARHPVPKWLVKLVPRFTQKKLVIADQHRPHRRRDHRRRQDLDDHAAGARRRLLRDAPSTSI